MSQKTTKLFLILASMILALSCKNPLGDESGGSGGAGGAGGGGGSGGGETIGSNYILPKGSLSQEEQKKILDPNKNFKVLFERVSGGKYYRIPALIVSKNGVIIAANDIRHDSTADLGRGGNNAKIDVVVKLSYDLGATWTEAIQVGPGATKAADSYGDAFLLNCHNGDVILGAVTHGGFVGTPPGKTVLYRSKDDGKTWTLIHTLNVPTGASAGFAASGQALTLRHGQNKDKQRLFFNYAAKLSGTTQIGNIAMVSDDDGATWRQAGTTGTINNNDETKAFELSDGRVMLNHRQSVNVGGRLWSIAQTYDGNFTLQGKDPEVVDPGNNADLVRYEFNGLAIKENYALLIHANSPHKGTWFTARLNHHIKLTKNEFNNGKGNENGKYTYDKQLVNDGAKRYSGYPTITVLPDGSIATLTEETLINKQDEYNIVFRRFNLFWLSSGKEYVDYSKDTLFQTPN
ncbi:sialidase family protein [uncultured Brachyspira sp.]|jgi:glycosyl hydrolase BNR repeat-containing protein|uniref:sialidase family protein n=1 Tax=uncultured Brachyspira sp. TaxID=221953 RepID=UPI00320B6C4B